MYIFDMYILQIIHYIYQDSLYHHVMNLGFLLHMYNTCIWMYCAPCLLQGCTQGRLRPSLWGSQAKQTFPLVDRDLPCKDTLEGRAGLTVMGDMALISSMPVPGLLARKVRCTDGDTWQPTSTSSTSFSKGASCLASASRCSLGFQVSPPTDASAGQR